MKGIAVLFLATSTAFGQPAALVGRYCLVCHNEKMKTAGLVLAVPRAGDIARSAAKWEKVLLKVRAGEMPPQGMQAPDPQTRAAFTGWLETQLDRAAAHSAPSRSRLGSNSVHRLNRAEYSNAVRDLLGLDLDHSAGLPPDDASYGFDNIGDVLTVSPLHMEKYMSSARRISRLAVGPKKLSPAIERYRTVASLGPDSLPLSERAGFAVRHYFPLDAEYSILVRVRGNPPPNAPSPKLDVRLDGSRARLLDVHISPDEVAQDSRNAEVRLPMKAGLHTVAAAFLTESGKIEGKGPAQNTAVDYVQIGGPFHSTGPGETESRRRIFICRPVSGQDEEACARKILASLARRAYRRPATDADMAPLMKLFAEGRVDGGSFEAGIETALRAILVSPNFLFRVGDKGNFALASRLSFFLWSSIPDEELLSLAEQGKLSGPALLEKQVRRMLADPKSRALIDNFAGQWLALRNLASWRPDPEKYPNFDEPLRDALRRESELFFQYIVREDRSVLEFLDAGYTFLNERLANYYGVAGVRGSYFRRVDLSGPERGGILTQGSVLTVTSYPTRTSPVLRGKWILENVLGNPPPPPLPNVQALPDNASQSARSLREQLEKHRESAECASCHSRMDPLGFALENYDAAGKFRTKEAGAEIDASGTLPGGATVHGPGDLKKVLLERRDQFVECLAEKLLTYALGRGLEYDDRPALRQIRREAARNDYKFSSLVLGVVGRMKRGS